MIFFRTTMSIFLLTLVTLYFTSFPVLAQPIPIPTINIGLGEAKDPVEVSVVLQILFLLTILSLAPAILVMLTSFTRVVITFSLLRHALGTHQTPPNQIIVGLSLFVTFFIMSPVWQEINDKALKPYLAHQMSGEDAFGQALQPVREFMFNQTRQKDLALFVEIAQDEIPQDKTKVATATLIPAFVISELKTAFQIGFLIYIPFLIIDMVVACVLLSMGMMMLPPIMISLPFKLLLFVMVDGWHLIVGSLVKSFA